MKKQYEGQWWRLMWINKLPKENGIFWFYGDPWWDCLPHDEEKGVNPFEPRIYMVKVVKTSNNFMYIAEGQFCYKMVGLFWDEAISIPELPVQFISREHCK